MQRIQNPKLILFTLIKLLAIAACNPSEGGRKNDSIVAGAIPVARGSVLTLKPRSGPFLASFRNSLSRSLVQRTRVTAATKSTFRQSMLGSLSSSGGIPRNQLEPLIKGMVDDSSTACDGVSCSRIFALGADQVSAFLDESHDLISAHKSKLTTDQTQLRDILLASLRRESTSPVPRSFEERWSDLRIAAFPLNARPKNVTSAGPAFDSLERVEKLRLSQFTFSTHTGIRLIQTSSIESLLKKGVKREAIDIARNEAALLETSLAKLPKSPGLVYRGISGLTRKDIEAFFGYMDRRTFVSLGINNLPATSSATWSPQVAAGFLAERPEGYGVIFGIKQRSGVSVEGISAYPYEQEVLLPASAQFQITKMLRFEGELDVMYVEMVEVLKL
jgi:hypothetical protein